MKNLKVAIIMGSKTDLNVMKNAIEALKLFKIKCETQVVSAHRTPEAMVEFALSAKENGYGVIIAGAGGAAHLPGMVASLTTLPVIGVPVTVGSLQGLDALLSIAQMPKGVPVATMAVDNAFNAGLLAARILSINDDKITKALEKYRLEQIQVVKKMNKKVRRSFS